MKWMHAVLIVAGALVLGSPSAHAQPSPSPPSPLGISGAQAQAFARGLQDVQNELRVILQVARRSPVGVGGIGDPAVSQIVSIADLDLTRAVDWAYAYAWGGAPFGDYALACRVSGDALTGLRVAAQRARQSPPGSWTMFSGSLMGIAIRLQVVRISAGCG